MNDTKFFAVKTKQGYRLVEAADLEDCRNSVGRHAEIREATVTIDDIHRARGNAAIREEIFYRSKKLSGGREQITAQDRFTILSRDNFTCQACGAQPGNDRLHVDHLLPWSLGGSNHPLNLTTLCDRCNLGKGARVWIPSRLLISPIDDEGFAVWKRFGAWNIEVGHDGIIANWPKDHGHTWFGIERCWESDWIYHFGSKAVHRGCDEHCNEIVEDDRLGPHPAPVAVHISEFLRSDRFAEYREPHHDMCNLADAIEFMRAIYRRGGSR